MRNCMDFLKRFESALAFFADALMIVCGGLVLCGCGTAGPSLKGVRAEVLDSGFIYREAPFQSCHASTLVQIPGGGQPSASGLLAAWFGGSHEGAKDVCIYAARCIGGKWGEPFKVADCFDGEANAGSGALRDSLPCWNPVLYRNPAGIVALFYKAGQNPREWKGYMKVSPDEGVSWTQGYALPEGFLGPIKDKPVAVAGRILCPSSVEAVGQEVAGGVAALMGQERAAGSADGKPVWKVHLETCDDSFGDWRRVEVDNAGFSAIQPCLLTYPDGSMQMLCRTRDSVIVQARSRDGGVTWSPLARTALPNNNSGIDAVTCKVISTGGGKRVGRKSVDDAGSFDGSRTGGGKRWLQVLVYNPTVKKSGEDDGRNKLAVAVSYDGVEWRRIMMLEDGPVGSEFSYPAVICEEAGVESVGEDGAGTGTIGVGEAAVIDITYTYDRKRIKFVRLRLRVGE